jgi:triphosphoribosyl-dephospho-CoA synthetase
MNGAYVGGFFSRIFGKPNQDGVQVMEEAIDLLRACAYPIEMIRAVVERAEAKQEPLTGEGAMALASGSRGAFSKAASAGVSFARTTMNDFRRRKIDCTKLDDVEIYAILTTLNALMFAGSASDNTASPKDFIQASITLDSKVGNSLGKVLTAKELLGLLPASRKISMKADYERYLHESLLPQLPPDICKQPIANFRD